MQFRDDILRGVRLAAIAFTVLLVGLIGYRMLTGAPTPAPPPQQIACPASPVRPKPEDPLAVPAPPTPVVSRKAPVRRPAIKKQTVPTPEVAIISNADPDISPPPSLEIPVRTIATKQLFVPEAVPEQIEEPSAQLQENSVEKPAKRGNRALRAIGHFLRTGK